MTPEGPPVQVLAGHASSWFSPDRIYFPFANGSLAYDCEACNAKCCKGHGYALRQGRETDAQLQAQPNLRFFLEQRDTEAPGTYHMSSCPPSCFFLSDGGLCGIHASQGYEAKPETCRLFPFNHFRQIDEYLIVSPHQGLCPLDIVPRGNTSQRSLHSQLILDMSLKGISTQVHRCIGPSGNSAEVIAFERQIVTLSDSEAFAQYSQLFLAQLVEQSLHRAVPEPDGSWKGAARTFVEHLALLLDVSVTTIDPTDQWLVRTTSMLTPLLRSRFVFRDKRLQTAVPSISSNRVPYFVMACHAIAALAQNVGVAKPTFQTVMKLASDFEPLLVVLAHADCAMMWIPGLPLDLSMPGQNGFQKRYLRIARALLASQQQRLAKPLSDILRGTDGLDPLERVVFLKAIAKRLQGRIMPVEDHTLARSRSAVRPRLQRWALAHLHEDTLGAAYERRSDKLHARGS